MPEVKILLFRERSFYDDYNNFKEITDSITDWEEISNSQYEYLVANIHKLRKWPYDLWPLLVVKDTEPIALRIESIKELIDAEIAKAEEKKRKAEEKKRLTKEADKKKQEEKELKLLEELKKKYDP